ncbi:lipoprotein signal peptidase [Thiomicrospira aerophila AL3]|uniref:Lipoprotein signal peptidase n=2 Tax=Thiomicrospira aerophila TaxID=92245 RepID=W0DWM7_9GAMM|nr:lipoprotein signal peptidase [Thiomicrospira aerophila AL3]
MPESEQRPILAATQKWLQTIVIGLNFCPFAQREFDKSTIHYALVDSRKTEDVLTALQAEWQRLDQQPDIATTLLILPYGFEGFWDYLELVDLAEQLLVMEGYEGIYQVASFHPDYCFADADEQDPANFTNRSPYPMLHILREAQLSQALDHHPDPEAIPQTNIDKARAMGYQQLEALRAACLS